MLISILILATLSCAFQIVVAQLMTPLYVPGFSSQPMSADVLGIDEQGRTTWALQGGASRTIGGKVGFPGTATLVQGPGFASITYADPTGTLTLDKSCRLSVGLAFCGTSTGSESAIAVETPILFPVQVGMTIAPVTSSGTQPTQSGTALTGENPPAQTSSQRQIPIPYLGGTFCAWLLATWPIWV
ncbi:hypothetical protein BDZ94DRAFT_1252173 [Collybia nuda]|uniref:Uncharacterized protein n=1 Tax=Collybia nuda TaxID=64659 RepID=A0A9P5YA14_9AGAR|nr:hypothetical protein BDZ94DRAFT_1252173 [Collybia nuda]